MDPSAYPAADRAIADANAEIRRIEKGEAPGMPEIPSDRPAGRERQGGSAAGAKSQRSYSP
jgi:hypothetical protein